MYIVTIELDHHLNCHFINDFINRCSNEGVIVKLRLLSASDNILIFNVIGDYQVFKTVFRSVYQYVTNFGTYTINKSNHINGASIFSNNISITETAFIVYDAEIDVESFPDFVSYVYYISPNSYLFIVNMLFPEWFIDYEYELKSFSNTIGCSYCKFVPLSSPEKPLASSIVDFKNDYAPFKYSDVLFECKILFIVIVGCKRKEYYCGVPSGVILKLHQLKNTDLGDKTLTVLKYLFNHYYSSSNQESLKPLHTGFVYEFIADSFPSWGDSKLASSMLKMLNYK